MYRDWDLENKRDSEESQMTFVICIPYSSNNEDINYVICKVILFLLNVKKSEHM